jgi:hypothetical protein
VATDAALPPDACEAPELEFDGDTDATEAACPPLPAGLAVVAAPEAFDCPPAGVEVAPAGAAVPVLVGAQEAPLAAMGDVLACPDASPVSDPQPSVGADADGAVDALGACTACAESTLLLTDVPAESGGHGTGTERYPDVTSGLDGHEGLSARADGEAMATMSAVAATPIHQAQYRQRLDNGTTNPRLQCRVPPFQADRYQWFANGRSESSPNQLNRPAVGPICQPG